MVEGQEGVDRRVIRRLHGILRLFILRRLKSQVEKQMPKKYEHIVTCRLSRRQRQLYDDYISSSDAQAALAGGNYFSVFGVLMALRKVCNHPDLFEGRAITSPFTSETLCCDVPSPVVDVLFDRDSSRVDLGVMNFDLVAQEGLNATGWARPRGGRIASAAVMKEAATRGSTMAHAASAEARALHRVRRRPAPVAVARGSRPGRPCHCSRSPPGAEQQRSPSGRLADLRPAPRGPLGYHPPLSCSPPACAGCRSAAMVSAPRRGLGVTPAGNLTAPAPPSDRACRSELAGAGVPQDVLPQPVAGAVRLWEVAGAGSLDASAEAGWPPRAHLHADVKDAGRPGGVPQPALLHIHAPRWHYEAGPAPDLDDEVQFERQDLLLHPFHPERGRGDQPDRGGHRHILRQRLEPGHGRPGAGPLPPHRADARCARVPSRDREHDRVKYSPQIEPEAAPGPPRHPERQVWKPRDGRECA